MTQVLVQSQFFLVIGSVPVSLLISSDSLDSVQSAWLHRLQLLTECHAQLPDSIRPEHTHSECSVLYPLMRLSVRWLLESAGTVAGHFDSALPHSNE